MSSIKKFLVIADTLNIAEAKHYLDNVKIIEKQKVVIDKYINTRFQEALQEKYKYITDEFLDKMIEYDGVITGSAVIQILLNEDYGKNSDIDILFLFDDSCRPYSFPGFSRFLERNTYRYFTRIYEGFEVYDGIKNNVSVKNKKKQKINDKDKYKYQVIMVRSHMCEPFQINTGLRSNQKIENYILKHFDFDICTIMYDGDKLIFPDKTLEHLIKREIHVNFNKDNIDHKRHSDRISKYKSRNFVID